MRRSICIGRSIVRPTLQEEKMTEKDVDDMRVTDAEIDAAIRALAD